MTEPNDPNTRSTALPRPASPAPVKLRCPTPPTKKTIFDVIKKPLKNPLVKDCTERTDALRTSLSKLVQRIADNEEDPDCTEAKEALSGLKALRPAVMFILSTDEGYDCHYVIPLSDVPAEFIRFLECLEEGTRDHLPNVCNKKDLNVLDDLYRTFAALFEGDDLDEESIARWKTYDPPVNIVPDNDGCPYMMRFSVDWNHNERTFPWHEYIFVRVPIRYSDTNMD